MDRIEEQQTLRSSRHRLAQPALGLPERLAVFAFAVACLLAFLRDNAVPMAIAP